MIGFGELRRRATEWKLDISDAERLYATDWLLKSVFDNTQLAHSLALRGASALRFAYAPTYSLDESPEFRALGSIDHAAFRSTFEEVARSVPPEGPRLTLADFTGRVASWDYIGPLGRRSAAQPHIRLSIIPGTLLQPPVRVPLIHRFTDACHATVNAVALEELAAERIVSLASPTIRVRDVYDLWFILTELRARLDPDQVQSLVKTLASARNIAPLNNLALAPPAHDVLARTWDAALRRVPAHPSLEQVERELIAAQFILM